MVGSGEDPDLHRQGITAHDHRAFQWFFIFTISTMNNLISFGLITGLTIIVALLGDILLAPAMMTLIYRNHES